MVVSLPSNLAALARETATTPAEWLRKLLPWLSRFVALAAASALVPVVWSPAGIVSLVLSGLAVTAVYALVMMQGLSNGPLGAFVRPRLAALLPTTWRPRLSERI
jgi:hypothetical protein